MWTEFDRIKRKDQIKGIRFAVNSFEGLLRDFDHHPENFLVFSQYHNLDKAKKLIKSHINSLKRDFAETERILATSTANGTCNRLKHFSRLRGKSQRSVNGFGGS